MMQILRRQWVKFCISDVGQRNIRQSGFLLFDSSSSSISLDRRIFKAKTVYVPKLVDLKEVFNDFIHKFLRLKKKSYSVVTYLD